jgi:putative radical SAM enzyme (TIGR03279 family)
VQRIEPARSISQGATGEVARVVPGSLAERLGLRAGDHLVALNGLVVRDLIDYTYESAVADLELAIERGDEVRWLRLRKEPDEELGLEFVMPVFGGIRECNNYCEFCFIRGLPKGLRRSLYIRDDDYRYSFLFGSFLTLTNLTEADWQRIGFQRLAPLCVSVHATDLRIRRQMLANPGAPDILAQLDRLGTLGVKVKAQVVLWPELNDGEILDRTVEDLANRAEVVDSVAIVPVGLTRYSSRRGLRPVSRREARCVVRQARRWQRRFREQLGHDFAYLSDELYLLAGEPLPPAWRYFGYRQLQNGVGLTRLLLSEWRRTRRGADLTVAAPRQIAWVCGRAAAPALRQVASDLAGVRGLDLAVIEVPNDLFGGGVTVSGLLAGQDMARRLEGGGHDLAVLPRSAFGFEGRQTIDDWTPDQIAQTAAVRVALASTTSELVEATLRG